jgi:rhamnosyltransferase
VQEQLADPHGPARSVEAHDWLIYAICRAAGWSWFIQPTSWVDYRQHGGNELGANKGLRSALWRLGRIRQGWHRRQVVHVVDVALAINPEADLLELRDDLVLGGYQHRVALVKRSAEFRRHPRDRAFLAALIATGLW